MVMMLDSFRRQVSHFVFMPLRIGVNEHLHAGEFIHQCLFNFIHDLVRGFYGHVGVNPDMKLAEIMCAAGTGAHIVNAAQFRMAQCDLNEALPFFFRPFAVQQLVQRYSRRAIGAP